MAYENKPKTPLVYHSALVKLGPVQATVASEPRFVTSKNNWAVDLTINGVAQTYWCENEGCAGVFNGLRGHTVTIHATGSKAGAAVQVQNSGPAQQQTPPARPAPAHAAPAPAPGPNRPHGATVGMAINCACANLTARGELLDGEEVAQIASGLLRVAEWLEAGNLMPIRKDGGAM